MYRYSNGCGVPSELNERIQKRYNSFYQNAIQILKKYTWRTYRYLFTWLVLDLIE
jgi:hypothetical protein